VSKIFSKWISFGTGASDVNARSVPANYTPVNYSPLAAGSEGTDKISSHLKGIDSEFSMLGGGSSSAGGYNPSTTNLTGVCGSATLNAGTNNYFYMRIGSYAMISGRVDILTTGIGAFSFDLSLPSMFVSNFLSDSEAHGNFVSTGQAWWSLSDTTVAAWSSAKTYGMGEIVLNPTGDQYISLQASNYNNALSNSSWWVLYPVVGLTDYTDSSTNNTSVFNNYLFGYAAANLGYIRSVSGADRVRFVGYSSVICISRTEYMFMAKIN
jgi:hypothetical protein